MEIDRQVSNVYIYIMTWFQFYKRWRLRRAQEQHAYWKARHESLKTEKTMISEFEAVFGINSSDKREKIATAAANEAKYMERVESLMREQ